MVTARSETIQTQISFDSLTNRDPKVGAAAEGGRPHFGRGGRRPPPICQQLDGKLCSDGLRSCGDKMVPGTPKLYAPKVVYKLFRALPNGMP